MLKTLSLKILKTPYFLKIRKDNTELRAPEVNVPMPTTVSSICKLKL
ncbi:hypothetical protein VCHA53O466_50115 [Vibrio chagasii]|nr:hypothetical protein VCHA53O466_50115 [Vibrio chagasii]